MPTDSELVTRAQRGDMSAFKLIVERYQDRVLSITAGMWNNRADAEDIAQEVFLKVYKNLANFRGDAEFSTWLYRLTVNCCQDHRRKVARRASIAPEELRKPDGLAETRGEPDPEERVLAAYELGELRKQLDGLPEHYRLALYLHYFAGQSYKEMAETLGISLKGVEARMARGRELLRRRMDGVYGSGLQKNQTKLVEGAVSDI
jgi:RNA polymerase sigma factor (sigma-70 family)